MKRTLTTLALLCIIATFSNNAAAQSDNTIDASATVLSNIEYLAEQGVNFGNIQPDLGPQPDLSPADGSQTGVEGEAVQFGYLVFSGSSGQTVSVSYTGGNNSSTAGQEILNGAASGNDDVITYDIEVAESAGNNSAASPAGNIISSGDTFNLTDENGDHTLWVGGTLSSDDGPLTTDTYSGEVVFTIDYSF